MEAMIFLGLGIGIVAVVIVLGALTICFVAGWLLIRSVAAALFDWK